jgi:4-diphosphocytidyl-2-C-methyl-D-erythritol kinase
MISFPNAKINLGLNIIRKRADGFHDLETVFYPVPGLCDALEIVHGNSGDTTLLFSHSGLEIAGDIDHNLCSKAYHLLKKDFPELPAVQMHLHKTIPMGAGLGGGSADGAFTLVMLNRQFGLGLNEEQLMNYALVLGSDCPFFILNKPCYATGRGEQLEHNTVDLSNYRIVLVNPGIHVPTGWAFSQLKPTAPAHHCNHIVQQPVDTWRNVLTNDFEMPVMQAYPAIQSIKDQLYQQGAVYASMTGTGSTVYGIFEKNVALSFDFPHQYFIYQS